MNRTRTSRRSGASPPLRISASETDEDLMSRVREGHRGSLRILLERYWSPLNVYAAGILDDPDATEDVVQETFIHVWRKRETWTPTGTVSAYLYRITRNLSLNARRDGCVRRKRHEEWNEDALAPRSPDQQLESTALRSEINAAIASLPERRREVFHLSRFHGLTHREIAEALGCSPQTVANQMSAALSQLRTALSHHLKQT